MWGAISGTERVGKHGFERQTFKYISGVGQLRQLFAALVCG